MSQPAGYAKYNPYDGFGGEWGYQTDAETGLVLCGQRYYDPGAGRWLTRDPIGYAGGVDLYRYCGNNPVMGFDPSGLQVERILAPVEQAIQECPAVEAATDQMQAAFDKYGDEVVEKGGEVWQGTAQQFKELASRASQCFQNSRQIARGIYIDKIGEFLRRWPKSQMDNCLNMSTPELEYPQTCATTEIHYYENLQDGAGRVMWKFSGGADPPMP